MPRHRPRPPMRTLPDPVDFGIAPPHGRAGAVLNITNAQSDALLTAGIVNDNSHGRFKVASLTSYDEVSDPGASAGEIPRGATPGTGVVTVLVPSDTTDGTRPLQVSAGQTVKIVLVFDSLETEAQDHYAATLLIQDTRPNHPWQPINARLIALVAGITTTLPSVVILWPTQIKRVPITIVSDAGPATDVLFEMEPSPNGVSMMAALWHIDTYQTRDDTYLEFTAAPDASLGAQSVTLFSSAFDGKLAESHDLPVVVIEAPLADQTDVCNSLNELSIPWSLEHPGTQEHLGTDDKLWSNYGISDVGTTFFGYLPTPKLFRPTDPHEVSWAIMQAEQDKQTIRALGSGWSFSDAVLPQSEAIPFVDWLAALPAAVGGPDKAAFSELAWGLSKADPTN